jgi:large subunit ribosomal protein L6
MTKAEAATVTTAKCPPSTLYASSTMFVPARRRCVQCAASISPQPSASLPTFLLPAFARSPSVKTFTTTSPCQSKIGSAPLSVPQGVTFNIVAPSAKGRGTRLQAMSTVQIKGPLGELSMQIPSYVNIDQDPKLSGPTLTIQDSTDAKQKEMWGTNYRPRHSRLRLTTGRYNPRLPPKPYPRRQ